MVFGGENNGDFRRVNKEYFARHPSTQCWRHDPAPGSFGPETIAPSLRDGSEKPVSPIMSPTKGADGCRFRDCESALVIYIYILLIFNTHYFIYLLLFYLSYSRYIIPTSILPPSIFFFSLSLYIFSIYLHLYPISPLLSI